jgi:hypothetical protein
MSFPFAAPAATAAAINPLESVFTSFNTNPYFIALFMLVMNLAGKYLAMGVTPFQDRFFQQAWFKPVLFFTVFFVATRNIFAAFWMAIGVYIVVDMLLNEKSKFFLFGRKKFAPEVEVTENEKRENTQSGPFTPEEQEIYNRLDSKMKRFQNPNPTIIKEDTKFLNELYMNSMSRIQSSDF